MRWVRSAVALLMAGMCAACSASQPSPEEVVGTWRENPIKPIGPQEGATLVFQRDGTFVARAIPRYLFFGDVEKTIKTGGSGTWKCTRDYTGDPVVELSFDKIKEREKGFKTEMMARIRRKELILFFWEGEVGGARFEFRRD